MTRPLAYDDTAKGPAVLLIHGHPFNQRIWAPQLEPLATAGFRVVAPDLRGYGSSAATAGTVTMSELAADVAALLDRLGIDTTAVVGLSMGGLVAMELVLHDPKRFWAMGLVATTAEPVNDEEASDRRVMAAAVEEEGIAPLVARMTPLLFGHSCPPNVVRDVVEMMRDSNPTGAAAALRGRAERPDYRDRLTELRIPAFVCVGSADPWSTSAVTAELVSCLADPRVLVLEEVGHLPNLEEPTAFNDALLDFLTQHRPADA
jgi:3-oxoadipate enol-lactonase